MGSPIGALIKLAFLAIGYSWKVFVYAWNTIISFWIWMLIGIKIRRWRVKMGGSVKPGFEEVSDVFRAMLEKSEERGGAFSVYHKGQKVVDIWGGYADFGAMRYRKEDTTSMFYSATKAIVAIVMAMLVDRGLLDYDKLVCTYWPEFAENDKKNITVKALLSHQAGLITIEEKHKLALIRDDPEELGRLLASQKPIWPPGTNQGYHVLTYGLYADQLVRKIDPKHRSLAKFFHEEIAVPFDIDFYIGEPKEEHHRASRETRYPVGIKFFLTKTIPTGVVFLWRAMWSIINFNTIHLTKFIGNPTDWRPRKLNDPEYRQLESPASHGVGTARGVAKLMGILANGGVQDSQKLLSNQRIHDLNTPLSARYDIVVLRDIIYGPGTIIHIVDQGKTSEHNIFGHWGAGGQMAYADPHYKLGWAYTTNYCNVLHGFIVDHRYKALEDALYKCIHKLKQAEKENKDTF